MEVTSTPSPNREFHLEKSDETEAIRYATGGNHFRDSLSGATGVFLSRKAYHPSVDLRMSTTSAVRNQIRLDRTLNHFLSPE